MIAVAVIVAAGIGAAVASYVLWWAAHRSGLWNFVFALILGLAACAFALLIAFVMSRWP